MHKHADELLIAHGLPSLARNLLKVARRKLCPPRPGHAALFLDQKDEAVVTCVHRDVHLCAAQLALLVGLQWQLNWRNSTGTLHASADLVRRACLTVCLRCEAAITRTPIL